jgi:hypothetical protein
MKLSKALKLKNKKISEYNTLISKMPLYNSYDVDCKKVYNSKKLYSETLDKMQDLIKFKAAIHSTSDPIRTDIFRLGELKNLINYVNRLDTREGIVKESNYRGEPSVITLWVDFTELEKVALIQSIQEEIEEIQDKIDTFNAVTELVGY